MLTAVTLLLCIAQLGPALVVIPAIIWLFWSGATGAGIILVVLGARRPGSGEGAGRRIGGGLVAYGLLGLFVGPVILGVAYTLLQHWMDEARR